MSSWIPVLPSVVAASEPRAALAVDEAAPAILDTGVASLTELHVLGTGLDPFDRRIRLHPESDVPGIVHGIAALDLVVLDERLPSGELVDSLVAACEHAVSEGAAPPVVVYRGNDDGRDTEVLPEAVLAALPDWDRAVLPGLGGLVVLVDPVRIASRPRLGYLLRHFETPTYLTHRLLTVDLKRQSAERRAAAPEPASPATSDIRAALDEAEARAARAEERAELAVKSSGELRAALLASQERILELMSRAQDTAQEAATAQARLSEVRAALAGHEARAGSSDGERRQLEETVRGLRGRELQLLNHIRELERITVESHQAEARRESMLRYLEAIAASRTWRWGHRIAVILRRLTFRRPVGQSALDRALTLARKPTVRGPAPPTT